MGVSFDEELLKERLDEISCFDSANIIEPKNPSFQYTDNGYVIIDEVNGNKVDKDALYNQVVDAVLNKETTMEQNSLGITFYSLGQHNLIILMLKGNNHIIKSCD